MIKTSDSFIQNTLCVYLLHILWVSRDLTIHRLQFLFQLHALFHLFNTNQSALFIHNEQYVKLCFKHGATSLQAINKASYMLVQLNYSIARHCRTLSFSIFHRPERAQKAQSFDYNLEGTVSQVFTQNYNNVYTMYNAAHDSQHQMTQPTTLVSRMAINIC